MPGKEQEMTDWTREEAMGKKAEQRAQESRPGQPCVAEKVRKTASFMLDNSVFF